MKRLLVAVVTLATVVGFADDGTWDWTKTSTPDGLTPETAADFSDSANWVNGIVPDGDTSVAFLVPENQSASLASKTRFIRVPDAGIRLGGYRSRKNANIFMLGGPVATGKSAAGAGWANQPIFRDESSPCSVFWYTPIAFSDLTYINRCNICAPVTTASGVVLVLADAYHHMMNWYATDDTGVVLDEGATTTFSIGSGSVSYYGRMGADEQVGMWTTTKDSPYLRRVGEAHDLAPGSHVSGAGIPEGAYLKRVFTRELVEISVPATETSGEEGVSVTFAAFSPTTVQHIGRFQMQGATSTLELRFTKFRASDDFRVYIGSLCDNDSQAFRITTDTETTYNLSTAGKSFPAQVVVGDASKYTRHDLELNRCDVEFRPTSSVTGGVGRVSVTGAARVFVSNDVVTAFGRMNVLSGTLTKAGLGELTTTLAAPAPNAVVCEEGLFTLNLTADTDLNSLTVKDGATLALPAGVRLTVKAATLEPGANIVLGKGSVLKLPNGTALDGVGFAGEGVVIADDYGVLASGNGPVYRRSEIYDPGIKGTPAFWITAESLTNETPCGTLELENGTNFITRWNDCRPATEGGERFATNLVKRPYLVRPEGARPYVKIPYAGSAANCHGLVWDACLTTIRNVFLVIDTTDGYGCVLGATPRAKGVHYLKGSTSVGANLVYFSQGARGSANVANPMTPAYVDGKEMPTIVGPAKNAEGSAKGLMVIEIDTLGNTSADAFGVANSTGWANRWDLSGSERVYEYVIYTNELTFAERYNVHEYLLQKYKGLHAECPVVDRRNRIEGIGKAGDPATRQGIDVAAGSSVGVLAVSNGVNIAKIGDGTLYLTDLDNPSGSLYVAQGRTVVNSVDPLAQTLPKGWYIHLDADAAADTVTTTVDAQGVARVTKWEDPDTGLSAVPMFSASTNLPTIKTDATNGRRTLDFGKARGNIGNYETSFSPCLKFPGVRQLKTVFTVLGSAGGGNTLVGGDAGRNDSLDYRTSQKTYLGTWRNVQTYPGDLSRPIMEANDSGVNGHKELVDTAMTEVRQNGVVVKQTTAKFSGAYDVFSISTRSIHLESNTLGGIHYAWQVGGCEYGEIVYYTNTLWTEEVADVNARLISKWLGRSDLAFRRPAALGAVAVEFGATLEVTGSAPLTVTSLTGAGDVTGSVKFVADAVWTVDVQPDGAFEAPTVSGDADLTSGGTVVVRDPYGALKGGDFTLIASATATIGGTWTCTYEGPLRRTASVSVKDGAVVLTVYTPGMSVIIR